MALRLDYLGHKLSSVGLVCPTSNVAPLSDLSISPSSPGVSLCPISPREPNNRVNMNCTATNLRVAHFQWDTACPGRRTPVWHPSFRLPRETRLKASTAIKRSRSPKFERERHIGRKLANSPISEPISSAAPRRRDGGPAEMSSTTITSLDRRLYAWLGEADDKKFERAFNAYFSLAFPAVVRHLTRISRWDPSQLEELTQDALLRFFERAGRGRREASVAVQQAMVSVRPLNFGPFHERQVNRWTRDVSSFRDSAMRFQLPQADAPDDGNWKAAIHALAARIPILNQQGLHILDAVRVQLRWDCEDHPTSDTPTDTDEHPGADLDETIETHDGTPLYTEAKGFANAIAAEAAAHSARLQAAAGHHARLVEFVGGTFTIVCALPRLRIPTNGYLFEIAMTIYLDECKKRGRQKRGGSGVEPPVSKAPTATPTDDLSIPHPIEMMTLESETAYDGADSGDDWISAAANNKPLAGFATPAVDPTLQYENEDLFDKFYEYLRSPVADATQAYADAQGTGRASTARRRLDSLTNKFARTTAVLGLMGEGYTQEQIAQQLTLSRNQVKYIIELVQEAYAKFAADSSRPSARTSHMREESNAP
jgi:DNA-directed RNA polymerase specialized sigma24 family protein